jgi:hypothetical protein
LPTNVGPELKTTPEAAQGRPFEVDRTRLELSPTAACDPWRKSVTGQKNIPSKAAEVIFHLFGFGDFFARRDFMTLSDVTRRRLIAVSGPE